MKYKFEYINLLRALVCRYCGEDLDFKLLTVGDLPRDTGDRDVAGSIYTSHLFLRPIPTVLNLIPISILF